MITKKKLYNIQDFKRVKKLSLAKNLLANLRTKKLWNARNTTFSYYTTLNKLLN